MEERGSPEQKLEKPLKRFLIQTKGVGRGPHYEWVGLYSTKDPSKPFSIKDVRGNEVELDPEDQYREEMGIYKTAWPETLRRLKEKRSRSNSIKRR